MIEMAAKNGGKWAQDAAGRREATLAFYASTIDATSAAREEFAKADALERFLAAFPERRFKPTTTPFTTSLLGGDREPVSAAEVFEALRQDARREQPVRRLTEMPRPEAPVAA
jgi:hypothetical protein